MRRFAIIVLCASLFLQCATYRPYYKEKSKDLNTDGSIEQSVFFFGGTGTIEESESPIFSEAQRQIKAQKEKSSVIVLGNITPKTGLVDPDDDNTQNSLNELVSLFKSYKGESFIIPGYEDWDRGRRGGWNDVIKLEDFIEDQLDRDIVLPSHACPGPVEYELSKDLTVLLLNTQWYLHRNDKPDPNTGCDMESSIDFLIQLEDAVRRNIHKKLIVVGYHPMFSNGPYGGFAPASTHLLPPVLGSVAAWYRKNLGGFQDLAEIRYRLMRRGLTKVFEQHPSLIYLSGHERSQQYHAIGDQHYIVSGTMGKATRVAEGNGASFAYGRPGFGKISMYKSGDVVLDFYVEEDGAIKKAYQEVLFNHIYDESVEKEETYANLDFSGQVETAKATDKLNRKEGKTKPGLLGENYRKEWSTIIEDVRVFDLGKEKGGLKIVKKGGGFQTKSLRLEAKTGRQYVLRSVEKFPEKAVPSILRGTIASKIVEDQVSASHPYGALVVPFLAEAAGVYHANPELVYLPDDPRLGKYRSDFANGLFLFEERPDDDLWKDNDSFDNPDDIISTLNLVKKLQKNDKHFIDQEQTIRSRLFDVWIGDWDRHDDQWRWAKYEQEDGTNLYRPIPRDRDQAFFLGDGSLINVMSRKWAIPRFEGFKDEIRFVPGMQLSGHFFDLTFLTEAEREDWQKIAKEMQSNLTDVVIESSIKKFPKPLYDLRGEEIIAKLKKRRDDLARYADELYLFRSKTVDVVGSNKAELFEINRLNDRETEVKMYRIKEKSGDVKRLAYTRVFNVNETKEIRLYGFGDDDRFELKGNVKNGMKVRIIGGKGKDVITDDSSVRGLSKQTIVYDTKAKVSASQGEVKNKVSKKDKTVNDYNRHSSKFDVLLPVVAGGFNPDDGIFIGGGVSMVKHGFRKDPFASKHTFSASLAPKSSSYNFKYDGQLSQVFGKWGLGFNATISEPSFADFFYGFGNKTISNEDLREDDGQVYRARYSQWRLGTGVNRSWNDDSHSIDIGGFYRSVKINSDQNDEEPNRFISSYPDAVGRGAGSESPLLDERRHYTGLSFNYAADFRDSRSIPTRGVRFNFGGRAVQQIGDEENEYQSLNSNFSTYFTFGGSVRTTLALRVGGEVNFGEFEFYQAPRLGGQTNLRGFRRTRFAGDEAFYQNTDLRVKLFDFYTPIFPGSFGVVLSHDVGRVWTDQINTINVDESFEDWHRGYGGGIWFSPFGIAVISADYMTSNNDDTGVFFVRMGFLF